MRAAAHKQRACLDYHASTCERKPKWFTQQHADAIVVAVLCVRVDLC